MTWTMNVPALDDTGKLSPTVLPGGGSVTSGDITDATTVGKAVLTASDAAAARTAIGAAAGSGTGGAVTSDGSVPQIILLAAAETVPGGTPAGTVIVRKST